MTTGEVGNYVPEFDLAFIRGGFLNELAQPALKEARDLAPEEVAEILAPARGDAEFQKLRSELVDGASVAVRTAAEARRGSIMQLADRMDLRRPESISDIDLSLIDPVAAVWLIEGGGGKTSVVRRNLALNTMFRVYGADPLPNHELFQIGARRRIDPTRPDGKPNAEYQAARQISGNFFQASDNSQLTESGVGLGSALASGWSRQAPDAEGQNPEAFAQRVSRLGHRGMPRLTQVEPKSTHGSGFAAGLSAIAEISGGLNHRQLVVVTNGQYRTKDAWLANRWADSQGIDMKAPVVIGDEAGFTTEHLGEQLITASRREMVYVVELAKLWRLKHHQYDQL